MDRLELRIGEVVQTDRAVCPRNIVRRAPRQLAAGAPFPDRPDAATAPALAAHPLPSILAPAALIIRRRLVYVPQDRLDPLDLLLAHQFPLTLPE